MRFALPATLVRPSTQAFVREGRKARGYGLWQLLHGFAYARWPYLYISIATGEHPLMRLLDSLHGKTPPSVHPPQPAPATRAAPAGNEVTFADTYHGKVVPLDSATQLVTVQREISASLPEQVIPYTRARDIVLMNPDHIVALECPCRAARPKPCQPMDVCLVIGEPFASFVVDHHPGRARWITQKEAVRILEEEDSRGHVHHAFFKDAMLNRFYAICNCCSCCCGALQAHQHGTPMLASSGYVATVDRGSCAGCGECSSFCQFHALALHNGQNAVDDALCMGCGVCIDKCEHGALSLTRDASRGEPLEIRRLMEEAELTAP